MKNYRYEYRRKFIWFPKIINGKFVWLKKVMVKYTICSQIVYGDMVNNVVSKEYLLEGDINE